MSASLRTKAGAAGGSGKCISDESNLGRILVGRIRDGAFHAPVRKLPPSVHLYSWGDPGDWLYLVQSGWVKSLTWSWGGKPCLLAINGPTDLLGVSSLITRRRSETAVTKTPAEIRVIAGDQFQQIMADPRLRDAWDRCLAGWIADQQEALTHFVTLDSKRRLATTLLRLARKHGVRSGAALCIACRITHDELGQMVGTTRSRVGYFLRCFEDDDLVQRRAQAIVVHEDRLLEYLLTAP